MNYSDILVIGAGPIGLETAARLKADGHEVTTIDAGAVGATIERTFPPQTRFFTSPERLTLAGIELQTTAQEKVTGEEYLAYLRAFVLTKDLNVETFRTARAIHRISTGFRITAEDRAGQNHTYTCRNLVLATGGTHNPRRLAVPGEDLPHVDHYLTHPNRYFQRRVLVVGGRNSAAESALRLYRLGAQVELSYRGPELNPRIKFWIRPEVSALIGEGLITSHMSTVVETIRPHSVTLRNQESGLNTEVFVDDVLLQIGFEQDPEILRMAGVSITEPAGAPEFDPRTMESDQPGIYVVGTVTAGTQSRFGVFIENCHQHAERVAAALSGRPAPAERPARVLPES